jgi:hypothetical protein
MELSHGKDAEQELKTGCFICGSGPALHHNCLCGKPDGRTQLPVVGRSGA